MLKKRLSRIALLATAIAFTLTGLPACSDDDDDDIIAVTGVTLDSATKSVTVGDDPIKLTPTVEPRDASNKTVT